MKAEKTTNKKKSLSPKVKNLASRKTEIFLSKRSLPNVSTTLHNTVSTKKTKTGAYMSSKIRKIAEKSPPPLKNKLLTTHNKVYSSRSPVRTKINPSRSPVRTQPRIITKNSNIVKTNQSSKQKSATQNRSPSLKNKVRKPLIHDTDKVAYTNDRTAGRICELIEKSSTHNFIKKLYEENMDCDDFIDYKSDFLKTDLNAGSVNEDYEKMNSPYALTASRKQSAIQKLKIDSNYVTKVSNNKDPKQTSHGETLNITVMGKNNCEKIYEETMNLIDKNKFKIQANITKHSAQIRFNDQEDSRILNITKQKNSPKESNRQSMRSNNYTINNTYSTQKTSTKINKFSIDYDPYTPQNIKSERKEFELDNNTLDLKINNLSSIKNEKSGNFNENSKNQLRTEEQVLQNFKEENTSNKFQVNEDYLVNNSNKKNKDDINLTSNDEENEDSPMKNEILQTTQKKTTLKKSSLESDHKKIIKTQEASQVSTEQKSSSQIYNYRPVEKSFNSKIVPPVNTKLLETQHKKLYMGKTSNNTGERDLSRSFNKSINNYKMSTTRPMSSRSPEDKKVTNQNSQSRKNKYDKDFYQSFSRSLDKKREASLNNLINKNHENRKLASNAPIRLNLAYFLSIDELYWGLMKEINTKDEKTLHFKKIADLQEKLNIYLKMSLSLVDCNLSTLFKDVYVAKAIVKSQTYEIASMAIILNLYSYEIFDQFELKQVLLYIYKNFIICLDFVMDRSSLQFTSNEYFLRMKNLLSKRKNYFDVKPNLDYREKANIILNNIDNFLSLLMNCSFKNFKYLNNIVKKANNEITSISYKELYDNQLSVIDNCLRLLNIDTKKNNKTHDFAITLNKSGEFHDFAEKVRKIRHLQLQQKYMEHHNGEDESNEEDHKIQLKNDSLEDVEFEELESDIVINIELEKNQFDTDDEEHLNKKNSSEFEVRETNTGNENNQSNHENLNTTYDKNDFSSEKDIMVTKNLDSQKNLSGKKVEIIAECEISPYKIKDKQPKGKRSISKTKKPSKKSKSRSKSKPKSRENTPEQIYPSYFFNRKSHIKSSSDVKKAKKISIDDTKKSKKPLIDSNKKKLTKRPQEAIKKPANKLNFHKQPKAVTENHINKKEELLIKKESVENNQNYDIEMEKEVIEEYNEILVNFEIPDDIKNEIYVDGKEKVASEHSNNSKTLSELKDEASVEAEVNDLTEKNTDPEYNLPFKKDTLRTKHSLLGENQLTYDELYRNELDESDNGPLEQNDENQEKRTDANINSFIFQDEKLTNDIVSEKTDKNNEAIQEKTNENIHDKDQDLLIEEIQPQVVKQEELEFNKDLNVDEHIYTFKKLLENQHELITNNETPEDKKLAAIIELNQEPDITDTDNEFEKYLLPPRKSEQSYTLVVDLDETQIHYKENFEPKSLHILVRPYSRDFLKKMSESYEIVIFTAATKEYADKILDTLDTGNSISYRLYRHHTSQVDGINVKDLSKLGRNLNSVIIIDDISDNFYLQPENGIAVTPWTGKETDQALIQLAPLLKQITANKWTDVRQAQKQYREKMIENIRKGNINPHLNLTQENKETQNEHKKNDDQVKRD